jgi:hypothetical protein
MLKPKPLSTKTLENELWNLQLDKQGFTEFFMLSTVFRDCGKLKNVKHSLLLILPETTN